MGVQGSLPSTPERDYVPNSAPPRSTVGLSATPSNSESTLSDVLAISASSRHRRTWKSAIRRGELGPDEIVAMKLAVRETDSEDPVNLAHKLSDPILLTEHYMRSEEESRGVTGDFCKWLHLRNVHDFSPVVGVPSVSPDAEPQDLPEDVGCGSSCVKFVLLETRDKTVDAPTNPVAEGSPSFAEKIRLCHPALLVETPDPLLLEWDSAHSLCIPKNIDEDTSDPIFFYFEIPSSRDEIPFFQSVLAEGIVHWNTEMVYDTAAGLLNGSALDFINDMLSRLSLASFPSESPIGRLAERFRAKQSVGLALIAGEAMMEKLSLKRRETKFPTHVVLDEYLSSLLETDSEFPVNFEDEWNLLCAFDRGYWLLNRYCRDRLQFCPQGELTVRDRALGNEENWGRVMLNCPIGDPLKDVFREENEE